MRFIFFLVLCLSSTLHAFHPDRYAAIVIDGKTGQVLHAEKADKLRHPASLTKMMTLYLTFKYLDARKVSLKTYVPISRQAAKQPPTKMGLRPQERVFLEDLIYGVALDSANDGARAVAEFLGGTADNFVRMMNQEARRLGMTHTRFYTPSGLPHPHQLTTARDMALLVKALYDHFPHHTHYFATENYSFRGKVRRNHNRLLGKYLGMNGVKTGWTNKSGFNLAASAVRGHKHVIAVVFGGNKAAARDQRMVHLINHGFSVMGDACRPQLYLVSSTISHGRPVQDTGALPKKGLAHSVFKQADTQKKFSSLLQESTTIKLVRGNQVQLIQVSAKPQRAAAQTGEGWAIQLGAYPHKRAASQAAQALVRRVPRLLKAAQVQVEPQRKQRRTLYRLRMLGLNKAQAVKACRLLKRRGQACEAVDQRRFAKAASV